MNRWGHGQGHGRAAGTAAILACCRLGRRVAYEIATQADATALMVIGALLVAAHCFQEV